MKTTIELPDDLLIEAKSAAIRRRTTLKAIIEHALRRELRMNEAGGAEAFTIDEHGLPLIRKSRSEPVTSDQVYALMEDLGD